MEGFENGAFTGALAGGLFGGIGGAGQALGALGKLGTDCDALGKLATVAKVSGTLAGGMGLFDTLALGLEILAPGNALSAFNERLHSSVLYNVFQFSVSALAAFSIGGLKGFFEKTPDPTCFVAGTMILTAVGLVAIENIKAGDKVIATNTETFETAEKTVVETYIRKTDKLIHLVVNDEEVITTADHPFYVEGNGFVNAGELQLNDILVTSKGEIYPVEGICVEVVDIPEKVYNFQVEDFHTYYVGENGIWVHNKCGNTSDDWYKSTFNTEEESMNYHLKKHGKGRTIEEYTKDATDFYNKNKKLGVDVILKDGTHAIKIQTGTGKNKVGGYWTKDGKLVTFWD